jgi:hypothetical protein
MYLDHLKARYTTETLLREMAAADPLVPCTEAEVKTLEQQIHQRLPAAYREFLLWAGYGGAFLMLGDTVFYPDLPLNQYAVELLQEDGTEVLPPDAFVFSMHQGYQFYFFPTMEGNNPPVYYYLQPGITDRGYSGIFIQRHEHFTLFLANCIEDAKDYWFGLGKRAWEAGQNPKKGLRLPLHTADEANRG